MDDRVKDLVLDLKNGYLTRRGFMAKASKLGLSAAGALALAGVTWSNPASTGIANAQARTARPKQWQRGRGWGWVWGPQDQLGNLNELSPELALDALKLVKRGRVFDLGLTYSRLSVRWPGHAPGEIVTFRSPQGVQTEGDLPFANDRTTNSSNAKWVSNILVMSDNVATQFDTFGHFYEGNPPHAYNGFPASDIVGDFGLLKLGAETIPPIVAPAVVIDLPALWGQDQVPFGHKVMRADIERALARQNVDIEPLDVVLLRYGAATLWAKGEGSQGVGANHDAVNRANTAGIGMEAARWLVEEKGALMLGADDVDLEYGGPNLDPVPAVGNQPATTSFNPVHNYLLVRQGVHILEFHYLDEVTWEKAYRFAYILGVNKIKGATAGTVQRPIGIA